MKKFTRCEFVANAEMTWPAPSAVMLRGLSAAEMHTSRCVNIMDFIRA